MVLVFLFQFFGAFLEYLPLFPCPGMAPLDFDLVMEPRFNSPRLKPVLTRSIFWSVRCLQYGQNLVVVFGTFMIQETQVS